MIGGTTMTHPLPRYANVAPKVHGEREIKKSACEQKVIPSACEKERKTSACEQKLEPSACQSETIPSVCGSGSTPSVSGSCKCNNCHDSESCSSNRVVIANGGYLRAAPESRPPVPCRQRRFTDDFSPEKYFSESNTIQHDTKRLKALDIPLPLPSDLNNDSVFLNQPFPNRQGPQIWPPPPPIQPHVISSQDRLRVPHPTPAPSTQRGFGLSASQFHRKPCDELPVPNRTPSTQPLIHDHSIDVSGKPNLEQKQDDLSHFNVTLPSRKSDRRKGQKHEPSKNNVLIKLGTVISSVLLIGLMYMVGKSVREMFFLSRHHTSPPQHLWNYSEPADSKLDTTVCFSCDTMNEFERHQSRFDLYGFKSGDNRRHCCVDQVGHLKWLISMMKTNEILKQRERSKKSAQRCSVKATMVQIIKDDETSLTLNNEGMTKLCKGASINVTKNSLTAKKEGMYMLYMTMSVVLKPDNEATGHKVLKAYISCSKSKKGKCIEVETLNKTQPLVGTYYHVFNIYTVKQFTSGERFYPVLSEPKYIYPPDLGNFIGVVEL